MKHCRHSSKLFSNILRKKTFNNISLPRLSKNMSITVQNMTESPNKISKLCPGIVKSLVLD